MKTTILVSLLMISFAAQAEMYQILESRPVYDTEVVRNVCRYDYDRGQRICEAMARPDRPYPSPIAFNITARREATGEVIRFQTRHEYGYGTRVNINPQ